MDKGKLKDERYFRIHFDDCQLVLDVNDDNVWEDILNRKENIIEIRTLEWTWNLISGEVIFH
jgi:hypothetical protein